ncbi:DNA-directed RNA polymerase III subunit C37 [Saccharomyces cerevisiae]|uniref:K7_Rpc37p n=1 Tax=Saccharomyces cerevisiae (strain Kyokai no. 7 / NBRC 101557) TaxID=721032 RepID=G2WI56_YEASK|nr:Rpc37p [Saccharomyces cerevisiae YJM195]AJS32651.1 Rpc37p [Saccharomyces cerevisiae YJM326]AJS32953.1 Rpc37p [Saccharomyces cerevisiae YJM428]AJS33494.1 Rpc37p [Saccharomyces cerevisiae YJM451]AJS34401.1 Rpc37p [Saccharomyces cerevisiae YJM470]AJS35003.1 Rpc37p [Saccharomyces cerevisiae YJM554]AJS35303.1 Rpc37p [Saccharomyces cerevisiae YJM555]AJS35602.1 Rpc37p [Saccharomyces cerevisiae YJM627]AJS36502.1 Rpc37p [Saccharomyces cerevisiae YJM683]AJS40096.1 Rpc37p [Saccharomyces cerevisiae
MSIDNKLFVTEEDEEDRTQDRADVEDESNDIDMIADENGTNSAIANEQEEKSEEVKAEDDTGEEEEDDPVIEEFPLNISGEEESLHVFQYANRPRLVGRKPAEHPFISAARYKPKSHLWEIDIPLDEQAFYNKDKAESEWNGVNVQTLKGVGVENNGQYAAFVKDMQVYLVPIERVAQLKPFFKYIDDANVTRKQEDARRNPNPSSQRAQVVTMSVKSVNDPSQNRLTGSLLAHKVADEEANIELTWAEGTFEQFKDTIVKEAEDKTLVALEKQEDYIDNLV